ncbi:lytic transglycosylase domain-containing protein [bacterium]|nr:lytic transglycosylase domain-containing protein [bacterium]
MSRSVQISNYVNNLNRTLQPKNVQANPLDSIYPPSSNNVQSFEKVLSSTSATNFGSLLLNANSLNVSANVYDDDISSTTNITNQTLLNAIQEVEDAKRDYSSLNKTSSKSQILNMVNQIARKNGVDEKLVQALIKQESGFNPNATSKAGAMGLMQLMPATAKAMGVQDPYNATQNVEGGVKYLKSLLNKYNGNVILALSAYNAGPGAVDKYDGVPPYKETQNYVKNILSNYL